MYVCMYVYIYINTVIFIIAKPEKEALAREAFKDTAIDVTT